MDIAKFNELIALLVSLSGQALDAQALLDAAKQDGIEEGKKIAADTVLQVDVEALKAHIAELEAENAKVTADDASDKEKIAAAEAKAAANDAIVTKMKEILGFVAPTPTPEETPA